VSNTDSFIDEVTEEVRRDRLFALMRRYGWIAVLAILLLVGGAAWNEWRKAREASLAQAAGDALATAQEIEVRFEPHAAGSRVTLEHRRWERYGEGAAAMHAQYETGWDGVFVEGFGAS